MKTTYATVKTIFVQLVFYVKKIDISVILRSHTYRTSNKMQLSMHCSFHRISISWLEVAILLRRFSKCFHCMMEFEIDRQYPVVAYVLCVCMTFDEAKFTFHYLINKIQFYMFKHKEKKKKKKKPNANAVICRVNFPMVQSKFNDFNQFFVGKSMPNRCCTIIMARKCSNNVSIFISHKCSGTGSNLALICRFAAPFQ